ncbi:hypothetical protein HPP92_005009 [Vanilla planifolia]|uniref:Uncharacterized protein n=1 Tax=Vanilla planifolia TaxID=51239 RepID=A0A835RMN3_VANPL|nr:hypothetical protein HPP92_005009 [Vanilla planifolia]
MGGLGSAVGRSREQEEGEDEDEQEKGKKARFGRCFTVLDLKIDRLLRELNSEKLKEDIRRWARAVVRYARQLSRTLSGISSSRRRSSISSSYRRRDEEEGTSSAAPASPSRLSI